MGDEATSRTLVVFGSADQVAAIRDVVGAYDRRPRNVSVEAWMLLVNRTAMDRRGVSYSFVPVLNDSTGGQTTGVALGGSGVAGIPGLLAGPAFTVAGRLGATPIGLGVFIEALTSAGIAETETRPLVMTTSEREGRISVGDSYILPNAQPILAGGGVILPGQVGSGSVTGDAGAGGTGAGGQVAHGGAAGGAAGTIPAGGFAQFLTGTTLKVTPIVLAGGRQVRMKVDLVRDGGTLSPDGRSITGGRHSTTTEVIVDDDTPIVIGSFTVEGHARASTRVPLLGSVPVLGRLFRKDEVSSNSMDLVIVLVPHVHDDPEREP
jgi:type II secretory pathway component GspD/PulD (secretin)